MAEHYVPTAWIEAVEKEIAMRSGQEPTPTTAEVAEVAVVAMIRAVEEHPVSLEVQTTAEGRHGAMQDAIRRLRLNSALNYPKGGMVPRTADGEPKLDMTDPAQWVTNQRLQEQIDGLGTTIGQIIEYGRKSWKLALDASKRSVEAYTMAGRVGERMDQVADSSGSLRNDLDRLLEALRGVVVEREDAPF